MVGGANSRLESNPIPTKDTHRAQTNLCVPGPRDSTETETELCLSISCGGTGWWWPATGTGALGTADLIMMKLEPIIQSEVSQKEKHQYSILTHIYGL